MEYVIAAVVVLVVALTATRAPEESHINVCIGDCSVETVVDIKPNDQSSPETP